VKDPQGVVAMMRQVVVNTKTKILVFWKMQSPLITTTHPDTAKILLKSLAPKPKSTGSGYHGAIPWIGKCVFSMMLMYVYMFCELIYLSWGQFSL